MILRRAHRDYQPQYPDPIRGRAGYRVKILRRDEEYPEWTWCLGEDGRAGWVPLIFLEITAADGVLVCDYDATELEVRTGDEIFVTEEIGGWIRGTNTSERTGWVPTTCLEPGVMTD